jgi:hypothetical protein
LLSTIPSNPSIHPSRSQNFNHSNPPPEHPLPSKPEEVPPRRNHTSFDLPLPKPFLSIPSSDSTSTSETIPSLQRQVAYWREKAELQDKQIAHQKELRLLKDREIAALRELLATAEKGRMLEVRNMTALNAPGSKFEGRGRVGCIKGFWCVNGIWMDVDMGSLFGVK